MTEREKLIELLGEDVCKHDGCYDCEYDCDRDACISVFKNSMADHLLSNGVTFQKWIPVTDRLPEKDQEVLCLLGDGEFWLAVWNYYDDGLWTDGERWESKCFVTHWMLLPEPPKEEENV